MGELATYGNDRVLQELLFPMMNILDEKNITDGVSVITEYDKIYICFDRNCLSETNQIIFEKTSYVYSETLFYTDNKTSPKSDRLEYWCPDEWYDKERNITQRCRNKKIMVLELNQNDYFTIMGTSIMLANVFQEQDPLNLSIYQKDGVLPKEVLERHEHYVSSGCPDLRWIYLTVHLNSENPLKENMYAPTVGSADINSPVTCDNIVLSALAGYNQKTYLSFILEKDELGKAVREYFENRQNKLNLEQTANLDEEIKKLLLTKENQ